MSKLDDILFGVEQTHSDFATDDELELGREKIKMLMLELVGEDEPGNEPGKSPIDIGSEFQATRLQNGMPATNYAPPCEPR